MSDTGFEHFSGTMPVSSRQQIPIDSLAAWMAAHVEGFQGPIAIEQFKGGQSNPTFKLVTPSMTYVMRSKPGPVAKLLPSAHAIEREFRVMAALRKADMPLAKMMALCEDESIIGRAFFIMEFVDGRVLWNPALPGMTTSGRAEIFDAMNSTIARLHQVDFAAVGPPILVKPAIISNARSDDGPNSIAHRRPRKSSRWISSSNGCLCIFRRAKRPRSFTVITGWTI